METQPDAADAAAALQSVAASRARLADEILTPWWYHPLLGLLVGALIAVQAVPSALLRSLFVVPYGIGLGLLVSAYRRRTGVWVNGFHCAGGRPWAVGLAVLVPGLWGGSLGLRAAYGWSAAPLVAGVLAVAGVVVLGQRFDQATRADLRRSGATSPRNPR